MSIKKHVCLLSILLLIITSCDLCQNEVLKTESIDESYKVVLFTRDGGATTSVSMQLSILPNNKELGNKSGNICVTDGSLKYEIKDNTIKIVYDGNLYKEEKKYKNYTIEYTCTNANKNIDISDFENYMPNFKITNIEQKNDIIVLSYEYFPGPNSVGYSSYGVFKGNLYNVKNAESPSKNGKKIYKKNFSQEDFMSILNTKDLGFFYD